MGFRIRSNVLAALAVVLIVLAIVAGVAAQTSNAVGVFRHVFINGNRLTASSGTAVLTLPVSTTTLIGTNDTKTLTSTTLDAEGSSNVITIPFTQWFQAARCDNATASSPGWSFPTTNPGVPACQTGTNTQYGTLDFADAASLSAQTHLRLPNDWSGTVLARFVWFTSATTGSVVWQLATICVANAETGDPAFNTASTVIDAALGTTLQFNDASITSVTVTGCAVGETMFLKLLRDSAHASDSLAATARLVGLELTYRRAM